VVRENRRNASAFQGFTVPHDGKKTGAVMANIFAREYKSAKSSAASLYSFALPFATAA